MIMKLSKVPLYHIYVFKLLLDYRFTKKTKLFLLPPKTHPFPPKSFQIKAR